MTVKLPPGVKLGKGGEPGEVISDSKWPDGTPYDERAEGEPTQPGDLVIEMKNGVPTVHTEPERSNNARSR